MKKYLIPFLLGMFVATVAQAASHVVVLSTPGKFEDVRDGLVLAIENRGLKINHTNHISDMLNRTGAAVGDTRQIYGQAEQMEFCKADLSREMMQAEPTNIVFCPYIISVYTTPEAKGQVFLAYRTPMAPDASPETLKAMADVDKMLSGIVHDAIQGAF